MYVKLPRAPLLFHDGFNTQLKDKKNFVLTGLY